MDKEKVAECWNQLKDKVKEQWIKFSQNELPKLKGTYEELKSETKKKYADKKKEVEKKLDKKEEDKKND